MWILLFEHEAINLSAATRLVLERAETGPVGATQLVLYWGNERRSFAYQDTYREAIALKSAIFRLMEDGRRAVLWQEVETVAQAWLDKHKEDDDGTTD